MAKRTSRGGRYTAPKARKGSQLDHIIRRADASSEGPWGAPESSCGHCGTPFAVDYDHINEHGFQTHVCSTCGAESAVLHPLLAAELNR